MKLEIHYDDALPVNAYRWTPKSWPERLHFHDSLEIGLCLEGRGIFYFSDKEYPIRPGDLFVVNNLELHIARSEPAAPCRLTFVNFDPALLLAEDERLLIPFAYHPHDFINHIPADDADAAPLAAHVEAVWHEMDRKPDAYRSASRAHLVLACAILLRRFSSSMDGQAWNRLARDFGRKRILLEWIGTRFRQSLSLRDLADFLGITESGASRAFRDTVGRPFKEHLDDLRVQEAKRRLVATDDLVTDICFDSGFQSMAAFYRIFRDATGLAPQDFRHRLPVGTIFGHLPQPKPQ
jgi:AraC-like DNA-binding protein